MSCAIEVVNNTSVGGVSNMVSSYKETFSSVSVKDIDQYTHQNDSNNNISMSPPANCESTPQRRQRRVSSALYEVRRKDLDDVLYLFVPDEYVSFFGHFWGLCNMGLLLVSGERFC